MRDFHREGFYYAKRQEVEKWDIERLVILNNVCTSYFIRSGGGSVRNRQRQRENRRIYKGCVSTKNAEGYTDMTASKAINSVIRKGCGDGAKKS